MTRWIDRLRLRLQSLFRAHHADAALAREIRLHLDEETREHIARGLSPAEARAAARRSFGSVTVIEDQCRDTRRVALLQNLAQDLRHGLRSLLHQPLLILAATASIGVGVGANTLIVSLASELLLAPPSVRTPEEVVNIRLSHSSHVSYRAWRELDETGALAGLAGYNVEQSVNWRDGQATVAIMPLIVTANFFDMLGVPVALGRGFTTEEAAAERDPRLVVVSHGFWQRRLGANPGAIGRTLVVNGEPYTLLGVLPADLRAVPGLGLAPEIYLPLSRSLMPDLDHPVAAAVQLVGRLRDDQSLDQGRAAFTTAAQRRAQRNSGGDRSSSGGASSGGAASGGAASGGTASGGATAAAAAPRGTDVRSISVTTFSRVSDGASDFPSISAFFALLLVVVALVLAIACANVAGLLLARSTVRRREIAVRIALGASRARLVQQLLVESLWLAIFGTAAGLLLMVVAMRTLARLPLPLPLPIELRAPLDLRLFMYALGLVLLATLVSGLVPALQATRPSVTPALKQETQRYLHRRWTLRGLLVTGQVAVSMVLLVTSFLFLRNLAQTHAVNPGFDATHTLVAQVSFVEQRHTPESRTALLRAAVDRVEALPGIERASFAHGVPLTIRNGSTVGAAVSIEGEGEQTAFQAYWSENGVAPGYFATLGIPVVQGRDFTTRDSIGTPNVVVVNDAFVRRYLGSRSPIGLRLLFPGAKAPEPTEIVGVVGNSKHRMLGEEQMSAVYYSYLQRPGNARVVHVLARSRPSVGGFGAGGLGVGGLGPDQVTTPMARAIGDLDPSAAVDVRTMRQTLAFAFLPSQAGAALLGSLGLIALTLAMAGLFAMLSYSVTRRTKEIGVRMALGATARSVARLVVGDAAVLVAAGVVIGLAVAAFVTRPLAMFLVAGLSTSDPIAFAGTALFFAIVSAVATWGPMWRAVHVEPVIALRDE